MNVLNFAQSLLDEWMNSLTNEGTVIFQKQKHKKQKKKQKKF